MSNVNLKALLGEFYAEAYHRGLWDADLCITWHNRDDGLMCAGVPMEERYGVVKGRQLCQYCHLDYEIRKALGLNKRRKRKLKLFEAAKKMLSSVLVSPTPLRKPNE